MMSARLNDQLRAHGRVHAPSPSPCKHTHKYTHANTSRVLSVCGVCVCTVCVCVGQWSVGWGPWLLTLSSGVRQQTAGQLDISISKTPEDPSATTLLLTHTHTHTHTLPRRSPPSFYLYLIFSCCGWLDGLWVRRSCSHSFLPNWGSNGEVYAGNLSSHWVMSRPLLSSVCACVCFFLCVRALPSRLCAARLWPCKWCLSSPHPQWLFTANNLWSDLRWQSPPLGLDYLQPNSLLIRSNQPWASLLEGWYAGICSGRTGHAQRLPAS